MPAAASGAQRRWKSKQVLLLVAVLLVLAQSLVQLCRLLWSLSSETVVLANPTTVARGDAPTNTVVNGSRPQKLKPSGIHDPTSLLPAKIDIKASIPWMHDNVTGVCLTDECIAQVARHIAGDQSFPVKPVEQWCLRHDDTTSDVYTNHSSFWRQHGLLLTKTPKAASSTAAGLILRLAARRHCDHFQYHHRPGTVYAERVRKHSYWLTPLRHPTARALSAVWYFLVAPLHINVSDDQIVLQTLVSKRAIDRRGSGGYQLRYTSPDDALLPKAWTWRRPDRVHQVDDLHDAIRRTLQAYDFVLVTERLDESLTALALLTNVTLQDVMVPGKAKHRAATPYRYDSKSRQCLRSPPFRISPDVEAYLQSHEWRALNYGDLVLHAAANVRLDATIATIGPARFARTLSEFRRLQLITQTACAEQLDSSKCNVDGIVRPDAVCYDRDFGCGYACVDSVLLATNGSV